MIIYEVPPSDNDHFRMKRNDLTAFDYLWNARFRLKDCPVPANGLLGPPGKGLAQAFSSLAKGRGGIGVNSAAKTFKLLAQIILDPAAKSQSSIGHRTQASRTGGLDVVPQHVWQTDWQRSPDPDLGWPRRRPWARRSRPGRSLLSPRGQRSSRRNAGDDRESLCHQGFASDRDQRLSDSGRSLGAHRRSSQVHAGWPLTEASIVIGHMARSNPIENYIGENMHEFTIATVYEGPNPVLADVGAPNAMTRSIRSRIPGTDWVGRS